MYLKKRQPIGVELVKRGIVDEEDIERALEYQSKHPNVKIGDCLYELDVCDPYALITAIGEILGEKGIRDILKTIDSKLNTKNLYKELTFMLDGNEISKVDLITNKDIPKYSFLTMTGRVFNSWFTLLRKN